MMVLYWRTYNDQIVIKWFSLFDTNILTQSNVYYIFYYTFSEKYRNVKDTKRAILIIPYSIGWLHRLYFSCSTTMRENIDP